MSGAIEPALRLRLELLTLCARAEREIPEVVLAAMGLELSRFARSHMTFCWRAGAAHDAGAWALGVGWLRGKELEAAELVAKIGRVFCAATEGREPELVPPMLEAAALLATEAGSAVRKIMLTRQQEAGSGSGRREPIMNTPNIVSLPGGRAVAISGPTGSGKTSLFLGSKYVTAVFLADSGSAGYIINRRPGTDIVEVSIENPELSPVKQVMAAVDRWVKEGRLWVLDNLTTLQEQLVAWFKKHRMKDRPPAARERVTKEDHQTLVGELRDLSLFLAARAGFVLFNTAPGGQIRDFDGNPVTLPKGVLVGYPALSGLREGSESVLARFTSSWVLFRGFRRVDDKNGQVLKSIPRGFLLPWNDFRGEVGNYVPIKDPMQILQDAPDPAPADEERKGKPSGMHAIPLPKRGEAYIDTMLEQLAGLYPDIVAQQPEPLVPAPAPTAGAAEPRAAAKPPARQPPAAVMPGRRASAGGASS